MEPLKLAAAEDPQAAPWAACVAAWAESLGGLTAVNYVGDVRQFVTWAGVAPWQINATHARLWASALRDTHAPASLNRKMAALASLYRYAISQGLWTAPNPFDAPGLRMRVPVFGRSAFPTAEEAVQILARIPLDTARGWRDFAIFYGLVATARRISEWLYVRWGDLSEDSNGGVFFTYRAKGGRMRRQVIPDVLRLVIDRYLTEAQRNPVATDFLFCPVDGDGTTGLSTQYMGQLLRQYGELAGIDARKLHLHGLRHAAARWRKEHGATVFELQDILAHVLLQTTQIYTDNVLSEPVDRLAGLVAELLPASVRRSLYNATVMPTPSASVTERNMPTGAAQRKGANGDGTSI